MCGLNNKGSYKWSNKEYHCVWHIGGTKLEICKELKIDVLDEKQMGEPFYGLNKVFE